MALLLQTFCCCHTSLDSWALCMVCIQSKVVLHTCCICAKASLCAKYLQLSCFQDYDDALSHIHFKAEGDVEFKALMFVPKRAPWDFYDNIQRPKSQKKSECMRALSLLLLLFDIVHYALAYILCPDWLHCGII